MAVVWETGSGLSLSLMLPATWAERSQDLWGGGGGTHGPWNRTEPPGKGLQGRGRWAGCRGCEGRRTLIPRNDRAHRSCVIRACPDSHPSWCPCVAPRDSRTGVSVGFAGLLVLRPPPAGLRGAGMESGSAVCMADALPAVWRLHLLPLPSLSLEAHSEKFCPGFCWRQFQETLWGV